MMSRRTFLRLGGWGAAGAVPLVAAVAPSSWSLLEEKPVLQGIEATLVRRLPLDDYVTAVKWSPDGRLIATSETFDRVVRIWEAETGRQLHRVERMAKGRGHMEFTADGRHLITSATIVGPEVRAAFSLIDVADGTVARHIDGPNRPGATFANIPRLFALSRDGAVLFGAFAFENFKSLFVFDVGSGAIIDRSEPSPINYLAAGPGPRALMFDDSVNLGGEPPKLDAIARTYDGGRNWESLRLGQVQMAGIALDAPGTTLLAAHRGPSLTEPKPGEHPEWRTMDTLSLWRLSDGARLAEGDLPSILRDLKISVTQPWAASGLADGQLVLYRLPDLAPLGTLTRFEGSAYRLDFHPDGTRLAVGGDREVRIFSLKAL